VGSNAGGDVYRIDPDGSGKTLLHAPAANYCARRPIYSHDGSMIAFTRQDDGAGPPVLGVTLWTMNADGTGAASIRTLLGLNTNQAQVSWSRSALELAFQEGNGGGVLGGVYRIDPDGTGEALLNINTNGLTSVRLAKDAWTEDGLRVVFTGFEDPGGGLGWYAREADADGTSEALLYTGHRGTNLSHFSTVYARGERVYLFPDSRDRLSSIAPDGTDYRVEHLLTAGGVGDLFYAGTGFDFL
jgi:Tol biopolymer transport system component